MAFDRIWYNIEQHGSYLKWKEQVSAMSDLRYLPLFPLNTVLFPGQALSLHVFEERYKLMINRCLEQDEPIGIVLIREGDEVGQPAVPHEVGTVASIVETERHDNGEIDIVAVGQERFVIGEILQQTPYIVGQVKPLLSVEDDTPRAVALSSRATEILAEYVEILAEATGTLIQIINVPDAPTSIAFLVALALQIRYPERQELLSMANISDMLAREVTLLRREIAIWRYVARTQEALKERQDDLFPQIPLN
jgi:Lon protease-like protein